LHGALLRCRTHFDKIGLKPALVEKRWLAVIIMSPEGPPLATPLVTSEAEMYLASACQEH